VQYNEVEKYILQKLEKELPSNLFYHDVRHTMDVRDAAERLAVMENLSADEITLLKTTALFHDAGFIYQYYDNEHLGVKMACDTLPSYGYSGVQITDISKLILSTSIPVNPKNLMERIICDADLDYLGREDFYSISYTLRREWAEYGKAKTLLQWYEEQLAFMKKQKFFTESAIKLRVPRMKQYIVEMKEMLGKRKKKRIIEEETTSLPNDEKVLTLKALSIFTGSTNEVLTGIAAAMKTLVVKSGQIIIQKGDIGKTMYIIHSGRVKVHDDIYTIAELSEGNFFGEVSLLDTEPRSASVTAIADSVLFSLEQEDFYKILQKNRDVAQGIMKTLIARFRKGNATIINDLKEKEKKLQSLVDQRTHELQEANKVVEKAFHQIEEKNIKLEAAYKDIRDSISYAKRIQQAILPSIADVYKALPQSFVYYRPKDIVSGDFYFFALKKAPPRPSPFGREKEEPDYFTSEPSLYPILKSRSEEFRNNPTDAEKIAWELLKGNNSSFHIRRQHIIGKYIVDFVNIKTKTVIEIDGDMHDYQKEEDEQRTQWLNEHGFRVIRFRNEEVIGGSDIFMQKVKKVLQERELKVLPNGEDLGGAKILLGVADCTGHGVPGAFMSMIGHDMLNQIIMEKGITTPSEVLDQLETSIRSALKQDADDSETKDGMDIALVSLEFTPSLKGEDIDSTDIKGIKQQPPLGQGATLQFSGAFRNLYLLRKDGQEVEEVRADKNSIGGLLTGEPKKFSNHQIFLNKGDSFYIFSDGYCDQFGGPAGKKFMSRQFQKILYSMRNISMKEQEEALDKNFTEWRGELEQVDDVLVIGVKI